MVENNTIEEFSPVANLGIRALITLVAPTTCNLKSEIKSSSVNRLNGFKLILPGQ